MAREEVKRSKHFMLKVVIVDTTVAASVAAVAAEYVAIAEDTKVDVEVVVAGGLNSILLPDHTLNRSGLFLATMRRVRYLLSAINMNCVRSMRSRYRRSPLIRLPILQPHITLVFQPQGRKRVPVTVLPARIMAIFEYVVLWCMVRGLL